MRRVQNADTHVPKQPRLSQNIPPVCSSFVLVFASDMHLESQSEYERRTLIYTQLKISRYNQHFFAIFRRILRNWPQTYLQYSDLLTHFHIFSWQQKAIFWHLSNFQLQNGQFYGCVFHISKDMVLLKMDPQLEGAVEVHPFSQTNMKFEPLSLLLTSTQSLHFHTRNSWIYSVNKNIKRFAEIENLYLLRFCVLPIPPKARIFPPRRQSYHSWWEHMMVKERNWD